MVTGSLPLNGEFTMNRWLTEAISENELILYILKVCENCKELYGFTYAFKKKVGHHYSKTHVITFITNTSRIGVGKN